MALVSVAEPRAGRTARIARVLGRPLRRWPLFSVAVISILIFTAATAQWIAPRPVRFGDVTDRHAPPAVLGYDSKFLLGADHLGRDILSRLLYGARVSLLISVIVVVISGAFGTTLGLISGWFGGWLDELIMRAVDGIIAMPIIVVAMVLAVVFGPSFGLLIGVLCAGAWPGYARIVRGETLVLKQLDYVALARISGASMPRILARHLLPGVLNTVVVVATLSLAGVILAEAGLSFLGIGVPPPTPSWGGMVADGRAYLTSAWFVSVFPGLAIGLTTLAFVLLGDWLRDITDPHLRQL